MSWGAYAPYAPLVPLAHRRGGAAAWLCGLWCVGACVDIHMIDCVGSCMGYHVAVVCVVVGWGFLDPKREIVDIVESICYNAGESLKARMRRRW